MEKYDRYILHEIYKERVKEMIREFAHDLISEIQQKDDGCLIHDFCDRWVDKHIKPVDEHEIDLEKNPIKFREFDFDFEDEDNGN